MWPGCSVQVAGKLLDRMQATPETGYRVPVRFELPIGQIPDVQISDPAEGRSPELGAGILLAASGATR